MQILHKQNGGGFWVKLFHGLKHRTEFVESLQLRVNWNRLLLLLRKNNGSSHHSGKHRPKDQPRPSYVILFSHFQSSVIGATHYLRVRWYYFLHQTRSKIPTTSFLMNEKRGPDYRASSRSDKHRPILTKANFPIGNCYLWTLNNHEELTIIQR